IGPFVAAICANTGTTAGRGANAPAVATVAEPIAQIPGVGGKPACTIAVESRPRRSSDTTAGPTGAVPAGRVETGSPGTWIGSDAGSGGPKAGQIDHGVCAGDEAPRR